MLLRGRLPTALAALVALGAVDSAPLGAQARGVTVFVYGGSYRALRRQHPARHHPHGDLQVLRLGEDPGPGAEVRIADDGEILVRGPSVFKGYWNRPEETKAALDNGWFKTGDIGNIDADGYLSVTDRKKDLIKTSGGKFIAPQPIENALKLNPYVEIAAILGDRRKFPAVMISPNFARLEEWARENGISYSSRAELVANPKVQGLYEALVEEQNQNLARFEKLKRVIVVPDEFSIENGALTPSLKLRRRVVEERYRKQIDDLYAEAEAATVPNM